MKKDCITSFTALWGKTGSQVSATLCLKAEYEYETRGCEDPRIVKIDGIYFMTYTAYDGTTARLSLATSNDLKIWQKHGNILKNWDFTKSLS